MRVLKSILAITIFAFVAVSCSDSNDNLPDEVIAKQVVNLHAKQITDYSVHPVIASGEFIKFSFKTGDIVTGNNWDIAFRGTIILVNGGGVTGITNEPERTGTASLVLLENTFSDVKEVPSDANFRQDAANVLALPKSTWYSYNPTDHSINPVTGKIIVVKTIDGNYAKMEVLSYYKDMDSSNSADPENSGAQYYTFNYVYNPNIGDKFFQ
ncbi:HmuY family protein [Tenacibaculum ovolyticum]|uniref:HmuY family protein n=1 Tax=Tenacibaculum ovolyticum TaxID=104270 RepID=UPI003BACBA31